MSKVKKISNQVPRIIKLTSKSVIHRDGESVVLHATDEVTVDPGQLQFIKTGVKIILPQNTYAIIRSIAYIFINNNVYVHPVKQSIFPDDSDEVIICLKNDGDSSYIVTKNSPVAAIIVMSGIIKKILVNEVLI